MAQINPNRLIKLQELIKKLGITDTTAIHWNLIDLALTHPSISKKINYQQLEFLGDAVVRLAAAEILLEIYPKSTVGEFASLRSLMVSDRTLAEIAEGYDFDNYLLMAPSLANDNAGKISRLADAFEAVLGALYLSTNTMALVRPWLDSILKDKSAQIRQDPARQNYKDALQEWAQAHYKILPEYRVSESNDATEETERFIAEVWLKNQCLGAGTGRTKKSAEQAAAKKAFFVVKT